MELDDALLDPVFDRVYRAELDCTELQSAWSSACVFFCWGKRRIGEISLSLSLSLSLFAREIVCELFHQ